MPKVKTNRGAAKRFSFTARGKIKRKKAYLRHILTHKTATQKRNLRKPGLVAPTDVKAIRRLLPNG
jgi:large subunit ribosomal protein L35